MEIDRVLAFERRREENSKFEIRNSNPEIRDQGFEIFCGFLRILSMSLVFPNQTAQAITSSRAAGPGFSSVFASSNST
jgi:hypothetical protein